jgi:hypothetical protein
MAELDECTCRNGDSRRLQVWPKVDFWLGIVGLHAEREGQPCVG